MKSYNGSMKTYSRGAASGHNVCINSWMGNLQKVVVEQPRGYGFGIIFGTVRDGSGSIAGAGTGHGGGSGTTLARGNGNGRGGGEG